MKKSISILIFIISFSIYGQSNIDITYSHFECTTTTEYDPNKSHRIIIDLSNQKITVKDSGYEDLVFYITETSGPLYQSDNEKEDIHKYYQFQVSINEKSLSIRYFTDKKLGLFIIFDNEGKRLFRYHNWKLI